MLVYDDYSNTYFFSEKEVRQQPILSEQEQRQAYRDWKRYKFYRWLMTPFANDGIITFRTVKSVETLSDSEWLKRERQHLKETERYLKQRQQRKEQAT